MGAAPSDLLFETDPLEAIENHFITHYSDAFVENYLKEKEFFLTILKNEQEEGFLGYHASSQYLRIMQDILRVVFQENLNIPLRSDFYFFRVPGASFYDMPCGIEEFLKQYDKGIASQEEIALLLKIFILDPFEKRFRIHLSLEEIDPETQSNLLLPLKELKYALSSFHYSFKGEKIVKGFHPSGSLHSFDENIISEMLVDPHLLKEIARRLHNGNIAKIINLKDFEDWFLLEYSPSSLYSKLINYLEQLPFYSQDPLRRFFLPYLDYLNDTSSHLLSMNFSLFSNYKRLGDSSLWIYLNNRSTACKHEGKILSALKIFFKEIGFSESLATELFYSCLKVLSDVKGGVLYQIYENPSEPFARNESYVSYSSGIPAIKISLENILNGSLKLRYSETQHLQLRLLMTNQKTLNPLSSLKIVRYDHTSNEIGAILEKTLREKIKKEPQDHSLKEKYIKTIKNQWNL